MSYIENVVNPSKQLNRIYSNEMHSLNNGKSVAIRIIPAIASIIIIRIGSSRLHIAAICPSISLLDWWLSSLNIDSPTFDLYYCNGNKFRILKVA